MALCYLCHAWWHSNPGESGIWLRNKIGEEQYAYLVAKAKEPFKFDKAMQAHVLTNLKIEMKHLHNCQVAGAQLLAIENPYLGEVQPIERKKRKARKKVKKPSRPMSNPKFKCKVNGQTVPRAV